MQDRGPLETVAILYNQSEIALLTARLRAAGISVLPHSRENAAVDWAITLALGGVRLQVPQEQAEQATALLAELPPWQGHNGVYSSNRAIDILFALLLLLFCGCPTPARFEGLRPHRLEQPAE